MTTDFKAAFLEGLRAFEGAEWAQGEIRRLLARFVRDVQAAADERIVVSFRLRASSPADLDKPLRLPCELEALAWRRNSPGNVPCLFLLRMRLSVRGFPVLVAFDGIERTALSPDGLEDVLCEALRNPRVAGVLLEVMAAAPVPAATAEG